MVVRSFRLERRVLFVAAMTLALFGAGPVSAAAPVLPPAFPDGTWEGQSVDTGPISKPGLWAVATGDVMFDLTVSNGSELADGTLRIDSTSKSEAGVDLAEITVEGDVGAERDVGVRGVLGSGHDDRGGDVARVPGSDRLLRTHQWDAVARVTSPPDPVTGDLATEAAGYPAIAGLRHRRHRVLRRDSHRWRCGTRGRGRRRVQLAGSRDGGPAGHRILRPSNILEIAERYEALAAKVAAISACVALPPGFVAGLVRHGHGFAVPARPAEGARRPRRVHGAAAAGAARLGPEDGLRRRTPFPARAPTRTLAKNLLVQFETALEAELDAAAAAGDFQTILDILVAAEQFGLDALAAKAKSLQGSGD